MSSVASLYFGLIIGGRGSILYVVCLHCYDNLPHYSDKVAGVSWFEQLHTRIKISGLHHLTTPLWIMAVSIGIEPMERFHVHGLANRCFNHSANLPKTGGNSWDWTNDTRINSPLLYRLSYIPETGVKGTTGLEPVTSCVSTFYPSLLNPRDSRTTLVKDFLKN